MKNIASAPAERVAVVEPQTQAFLDALAAKGGPALHELSVEDARKVLSGAQAGEASRLPADIEDRVIPGGPNGQVAIRIVRPAGSDGALPGVIYLHGGGWVLGDENTHDRLIRKIAHDAHAAVIFVKFSPSPEARYPVAVEEAYAVAQWVAEHGEAIEVDPLRLAVAGDSAGGNMAAAVTLLAKERNGPHLLFQVLFYPVTDATFDTASYRQFAHGHFLTREAMMWFWDHYAPEQAVRSQPTASPLRASLDQLRGLPPALVITGECDVLRDEGEAYARRLVQAGVPVTALRCLGTVHDFVMLDALAETPAAHAAVVQACALLRKALAVREEDGVAR